MLLKSARSKKSAVSLASRASDFFTDASAPLPRRITLEMRFRICIGSWSAVVALVDQAAWMLSDGAAIVTALDKLSNSRSLATLQPIINRISVDLDEAKVRAWATGGRQLRLATVSLETGRLRYVTESGWASG
jgi:hypothetical protein